MMETFSHFLDKKKNLWYRQWSCENFYTQMMLRSVPPRLKNLQEILDYFAAACDEYGLTIGLKTVVLFQTNKSKRFNINETILENVEKFKYLGLTMKAKHLSRPETHYPYWKRDH